VFLPFLTGERGGVAPTGASAGWRALTPSTGRAELLRAAFEAYAFTMRRGLEMLGSPDAPLVLSGGGGRDPWLRQLIADVLGRSLSFVTLRSVSAVGAAALAARGLGARLPVPATVVPVQSGGDLDREPLDAAYARWVAHLSSS
jgi:xylulokinase